MTAGFSQAITNRYAQLRNKGGVNGLSCLSLEPFSDPVSIAGCVCCQTVKIGYFSSEFKREKKPENCKSSIIFNLFFLYSNLQAFMMAWKCYAVKYKSSYHVLTH
jgi:hypothetical protein